MASDSNLDKIVADFIKVEDQNFALFNYVTEMNNQVEGLQESITKLRFDIKEAKVICFSCKNLICFEPKKSYFIWHFVSEKKPI